jgi:hypothetical protein
VSTVIRNGQKISVEYHSTPALYVAFQDGLCHCPECQGKHPSGWGRTEDAAVADLLQQIEEAA